MEKVSSTAEMCFLFSARHRSPRSIGRTWFFLQHSWVTGCPVRSSMGLGDWVGLEEPNWIVSLSDCWTNFPTGRCSIVEPWSCPLFQLRACFKEIFGGGRGDKCCLVYNFSPFLNQCFSSYQSTRCFVVQDQWDCSQNVLEEHGGKWLIPNYQSNTDIFV